jgi:plasmid stability protein
MTTIGGKFTIPKRNLVTYIEHEQYDLLKVLAARHGRSVSAEAALAIKDHLKKYAESLKEDAG